MLTSSAPFSSLHSLELCLQNQGKMAEELIEEQNSQSSELGEEHLNKFEEQSVPKKNTENQTLWRLKKFTEWC